MDEADKRRDLRDMLDELDKYFERLEKDLHESMRRAFGEGQGVREPFVGGFAMNVGPEGPSIQFFGDNPLSRDGFRAPLTEQILDDRAGTLRVVADLPGVEKESIEVSATDRRIVIKAEQGPRRYMSELETKAEVDPDSAKAEYKNGVLEITFSLRDKSNKGARRVRVV